MCVLGTVDILNCFPRTIGRGKMLEMSSPTQRATALSVPPNTNETTVFFLTYTTQDEKQSETSKFFNVHYVHVQH